MDVEQLIEKLLPFRGKKVLVYNGDTLCKVESVAEYRESALSNEDDGAAVIYLEE